VYTLITYTLTKISQRSSSACWIPYSPIQALSARLSWTNLHTDVFQVVVNHPKQFPNWNHTFLSTNKSL